MSFEVFQRPKRAGQRQPSQPSVRDRTIRAAFRAGVSRYELAALFGLGHARICQILAVDEDLSSRG